MVANSTTFRDHTYSGRIEQWTSFEYVNEAVVSRVRDGETASRCRAKRSGFLR
jgi:hypothetical protein